MDLLNIYSLVESKQDPKALVLILVWFYFFEPLLLFRLGFVKSSERSHLEGSAEGELYK